MSGIGYNMNEIHVSGIGLRVQEGAGFTIDRPWGLGCFLLLRFHSPMKALTVQGILHVEPGHCLIYSPDHPQWYRGREGVLVNDWLHIEGEEVRLIAARHSVPLNALLAPSDTRFLPHLFEEIQHERLHAEAGHNEMVGLLVRQLFLKLGRALRDPVAHLTPAEAAHLPALRALRQRLHEQLTHQWTVGEMAAEVGLSRPRFAALYQRFFGISPLEDLLRSRLRHAEYLLTNRSMTVREAAMQCGFRSLHYFSHVFHQRVGCPPSDYHRRGRLRGRERSQLR
jgi:AraC-like DNA-binding protein